MALNKYLLDAKVMVEYWCQYNTKDKSCFIITMIASKAHAVSKHNNEFMLIPLADVMKIAVGTYDYVKNDWKSDEEALTLTMVLVPGLVDLDKVNPKKFLKNRLFVHPWPTENLDQNAVLKTRFLIILGAAPYNVLQEYDELAVKIYKQVIIYYFIKK